MTDYQPQPTQPTQPTQPQAPQYPNAQQQSDPLQYTQQYAPQYTAQADAPQYEGYWPKCVSGIGYESLSRRACRGFESSCRHFRARPECVSGTGADPLRRKAYGRFECAELVERTLHDAPNATG